MPYPDTEPTVSELANNPVLKRELFQAINVKPKDGFNRIGEICQKNGLGDDEARQEMAKFFLNNKDNLDLASVADYIGSDSQSELLKECVAQYAPQMKDKDFTTALRDYFKTFQTPGEAQKVDRFVRDFAFAYAAQNPGSAIPSGDAAYQMAFQAIMLATDAHTPGIKHKMTFDQLKDNLQYSMKTQKIDGSFLDTKGLLENYYKDLTTTPLPAKFQRQEPSLELNPAQLKRDPMLAQIDKALGKKNGDIPGALGLEGVTAKVEGKKPMFGFLTGYKSRVTLEDKDGNKVQMEVSKPGLFSRQSPTVSVKPSGDGEGSLTMAAQVASRFTATSTAKSSFAYERDEMTQQVSNFKKGEGPKVDDRAPKKSQEVEGERVKLSRQGYRGEQNLDKEVVQKKEKVMDELNSTLAKRKEKVVDGPASEQSVGKAIGYKKEEPKVGVKEGQGKGVGSGF